MTLFYSQLQAITDNLFALTQLLISLSSLLIKLNLEEISGCEYNNVASFANEIFFKQLSCSCDIIHIQNKQ